MSRLKNYALGLASSYAQLGANVIYVLASVPLALSFLSKAEFGLWALMMPIASYLSLLDFGMTAAVSRLLIDHKDRPQTKTYGALIKTAFLVGAVQAAIVFGLAAVLAPLIARLLGVPAEYFDTFVALLRLQGAVSAFGFAVRPFALVLTAHQRMDLCSYGEIFSLLSSLGWLWLFLTEGLGVFSFVYATAIGTVIIPVYLALKCNQLKLFPERDHWGEVTAKLFREVFGYGKDVFLVGLGTQMVLASQTLIVSRRLGLEAAATWAVGTKMFYLLGQLVARLISISMPALSEMIVRAERQRLQQRVIGLVAVIASFSVFLGISLWLCNSVFVTLWTSGRVSWSPTNDILLTLWLFFLSVQGIHNNVVLATKRIGFLRYVFFFEGAIFLLFASLVGSRYGMPGIIATSIFCTLIFSFSYGIWRSSRYFARSVWEVAVRWSAPGFKLAAVFGAVSAIVWFGTRGLSSVPRLIAGGFTALILGGFLFVRLGIPRILQEEVLSRLPLGASRLLNFVVRRERAASD